jgi:hypothetical protein
MEEEADQVGVWFAKKVGYGLATEEKKNLQGIECGMRLSRNRIPLGTTLV